MAHKMLIFCLIYLLLTGSYAGDYEADLIAGALIQRNYKTVDLRGKPK